MASTSFSRRPRGTALIFAVVLLAVLAIVGLAIIGQANAEGDGSAAKRQYDRSLACADAAREMLNSQFRLYGVNDSTTLMLNTQIEDKTLSVGHYDQIAVTSVVPASGATSGTMGMSDETNRNPLTKVGGVPYRMTVVCSSTGTNARQSEIEFLVKFGL